ncbi:MAG: ATP-dependent DNA helicase RecG [Pseudomonadota bacterium]
MSEAPSPSALDIAPLMAPVNRLAGVGAARAARLAHLLGRESAADTRIFDLLCHAPHAVVDRRIGIPIDDVPDGAAATLTLQIVRHEKRVQKRGPIRAIGTDGASELALTYFRGGSDWLQGAAPIGGFVRATGTVERYKGRAQMVHPEALESVEGPDGAAPETAIEPVYKLTDGLTRGVLRGLIDAALETLKPIGDWHDGALAAREGFLPLHEAFAALHHPTARDDPAATRRLAFDELLASQLALAIVRDRDRTARGIARTWDEAAVDALSAEIPFALTGSQRLAIAEVSADLQSEHRMLRLLQGDVGAGKTIVAAYGAQMVAASGAQTAVMAPTDIVARQHFETLTKLLTPLGRRVDLLTGRITEPAREETLAALGDGRVDVVVGTHALFQNTVSFANLGLVVVDEQHRFGVQQRMALSAKGPQSDLLVMTATPIPRTLVLSQFGDMDVSRLTEKPPGRTEIETRAVPLGQLGAVVDRLEMALERGDKAYWICPLVEENETLDIAAATERHAALAKRFGGAVGLLHGRTPTAERERIMGAFRDGTITVLVATTVVEVGVDVPDATIIVIEHAERFGLSQLHQLRGRVGRGERASRCLLLYKAPLGPIATERLATMRATNDGFRIAEDDLKLRGEGELLGTRQSGSATFRFANLAEDSALLAIAADDARRVVATDRDLKSPRGKALRNLLTLYERRRAIERLRSG